MGTGPCATRPDVTHRRGGAPQGCDVALLDPLAERSDALDGGGAFAIPIDTAELVVVQTAARITTMVRRW